MRVNNTVKIYTPGTPEFDAIAKTLTPLKYIRKDHSGQTTYLDADVDHSNRSKKTRKESINKMR